ncbi:MAG: amidohydrolase [Actinomycetia bacterium]|nr:amidohydrolase [bacterium]MCG2790788.1 amidohydrolase [Actinomycetes bacterium]
MMDILIKNATIVTVNKQREILKNCALAVKGNLISDIGSNSVLEKKYAEAKKTIDATGKIIFPGLINTHNHLFQTLLKGLGDDLALHDWIVQMTSPSASCLTPEDAYNASLLGCIEGIHSGTTTMLDYMYAHPHPGLSDSVIEAFCKLKIRGIFARGMQDRGEEFGISPKIIEKIKTIEKDCRRLFKKYHSKDNDRIHIWLAPGVVWSNSQESLEMAWVLAQEYKTGFTIHISETPFDRQASKEVHGIADVEVLERLGIVGPNVLMVHCVYLIPKDIRMAKYYGMKVSHNAVSNMYLASGIAPIPQMIERGITVGLGTDGAASNNTQDMIETLKITALLHKVHTLDPTIITAEKVLEMATIDGAKALGLEDKIGSLEVGKKADLFIYNPALSTKSTPMHNPVSTLVYSGSDSCVETVVIDGNIILEDKKLLPINEKEVISNAQKAADGLALRAGTNKNKDRKWRSLAF